MGFRLFAFPLQTIPSTNHKARPSTLNKHKIEDTPHDGHATHLTYPARPEELVVFTQSQIRKTAYTPRASDGFPRVLLHRLLVLPTSKVSPSANDNKFEFRGQTSFLHFIVIRLRPVARQCATRLSERSMRPLAAAGQRHTPPSKIHCILYRIPLPPRNHPAPESVKSRQKQPKTSLRGLTRKGALQPKATHLPIPPLALRG